MKVRYVRPYIGYMVKVTIQASSKKLGRFTKEYNRSVNPSYQFKG